MTHPATKMKILFLCTGNSARSILAEYLLRNSDSRFETYSAGAQPVGSVNPYALQVLRDSYRIDASGARSKSWEELKDIELDFVVTVCDRARESCPIWPGRPVIAHWGMEDPAGVDDIGGARLQAFKNAAIEIQRRLDLFRNLPFETLDRLRLENLTRGIAER